MRKPDVLGFLTLLSTGMNVSLTKLRQQISMRINKPSCSHSGTILKLTSSKLACDLKPAQTRPVLPYNPAVDLRDQRTDYFSRTGTGTFWIWSSLTQLSNFFGKPTQDTRCRVSSAFFFFLCTFSTLYFSCPVTYIFWSSLSLKIR